MSIKTSVEQGKWTDYFQNLTIHDVYIQNFPFIGMATVIRDILKTAEIDFTVAHHGKGYILLLNGHIVEAKLSMENLPATFYIEDRDEALLLAARIRDKISPDVTVTVAKIEKHIFHQ